MATGIGNNGLPIPYITAVWSGMAPTDIAAGIAAGTILPSHDAAVQRTAVAPALAAPIDPRAAAREAAGEAVLHATPASAEAAATEVATPANRAEVGAWFRTLDSAFTTTAFDALWQRAGADDDARARSLQRHLGGALLGDSTASAESIGTFLAQTAPRARVVDLHGMTGADLAAAARTDVGYRHALATLQPFALTGNAALFANANADGRLDRFDPDSGERVLSDAWLDDRAKLLAWQSTETTARAIAGNEDWTFIDRGTLDADGKPSTFELVTGSPDAGKNQVVFGGDEDELLQGVAGSDRMYGGDGSDVVRGGAGGDHLEGGRGDDLVLGGAGDDELAGDQGADELDGGRGEDRLEGGGGADVLIGGRGDDFLAGGDGDDAYVVDVGDGRDRIVDRDGIGRIEVDGAAIGGTMTSTGSGAWTSADGRAEFSFNGDPSVPGSLTITLRGEAGDSGNTPTSVVTVQDWKNGDLGITLGGASGASSASDTGVGAASSVTGESSIATDAGLSVDAGTGEAGNAEGAFVESAMTDVAWGDVAPVGVGTSVGAASAASPGTDKGATSAAMSEVDAGAASVPSSDAEADLASAALSDSDADAVRAAFLDPDFESALAAIFEADPGVPTILDPAQVESAIRAFDGVLEAPDITASVGHVEAATVNAVTAHDFADALAGDYAGDELGDAPTMLLPTPFVPDVRRSDFVGGATAPLLHPASTVR